MTGQSVFQIVKPTKPVRMRSKFKKEKENVS